MSHAAADGRARGGLGCIACVFGRVAVAETLEHGNVVAAVAVNRDLVLGNTVVTRQPGHTLALVARHVRDLEHHRTVR